MQFTRLRKSGRKWGPFCRMLPQTVVEGRPEAAKKAGREKGSSLDKGELGAQENKEVARDHAGRRSDFWSPFQGVASEYQKGLGMCVVPCVQGCSPQHGVED